MLDQKLVTGLGNIYVDEALWQAKIHPEQPADSLTPAEANVLHQAIIDVLERAVEAGGQPFGPISMHWAKQENSKCH